MTAESQKLTPEALEAIAGFAGLELDRETLERLAPQLQETLARLRRVEELDLAEVEPAFILPQGDP